MIAFTDPETQLRGYRLSAAAPVSPRVPSGWIVLVGLAFLIGLVLGTQVHAAEAIPCVRLQVRPPFLLQRGDVDVQARVAHHADHRALVVSWDSDAGAGGSRTFDLEGDHDRALFQWINHDQPAGHYVVEARVFDAGGRQVGRDRKEIHTAEDR
jgi:hypothetical protein